MEIIDKKLISIGKKKFEFDESNLKGKKNGSMT